jgi:hypothetical protein
MPYATVPYRFTNASTMWASQINACFSDLVAAMSSGAIDYNIAALTVGTMTVAGAAQFGNGSADTFTANGRLAAGLVPATCGVYTLGDSTYGFAGGYLGGNSNQVKVGGNASMSSSFDLSLPATSGMTGALAMCGGSGVVTWTGSPAEDYIFSGQYCSEVNVCTRTDLTDLTWNVIPATNVVRDVASCWTLDHYVCANSGVYIVCVSARVSASVGCITEARAGVDIDGTNYLVNTANEALGGSSRERTVQGTWAGSLVTDQVIHGTVWFSAAVNASMPSDASCCWVRVYKVL